ncbi:MAG: nitroreductase family protein [Planctomycetota bacterium]|nr:nitroreductase family protein [Planctomycetota bacterium]
MNSGESKETTGGGRLIFRFARGIWYRIRAVVNGTATALGVLRSFLYDWRQFLRWSATSRFEVDRTTLRAMIQMWCHTLEKGLSLAEPRTGFGIGNVDALFYHIPIYVRSFGTDGFVGVALATLGAYVEYHRSRAAAEPGLLERYESLKALCGYRCGAEAEQQLAGVIPVTREQILAGARVDLEGFYKTRHSIRQFGPEHVGIELVRRAVAMAQRTPSACNRQPVRLYVVSESRQKEQLLSVQKGSRGFGDQASHVLVVTSDLGCFNGAGERNQCWVDGGMFAMSLVYALHSMGLGTCCLAWQPTRERDRGARSIAGIREAEAIIMLIAVGSLPEELRVAKSQRKSLDEVLVVVAGNGESARLGAAAAADTVRAGGERKST